MRGRWCKYIAEIYIVLIFDICNCIAIFLLIAVSLFEQDTSTSSWRLVTYGMFLSRSTPAFLWQQLLDTSRNSNPGRRTLRHEHLNTEYTYLDTMMDMMEVMTLWPSNLSSFFHSSWQIQFNAVMLHAHDDYMVRCRLGKKTVFLFTPVNISKFWYHIAWCIFNLSHTKQQQYHPNRELSNMVVLVL